MKRHIAGQTVREPRESELAAPDVRAIREAAQISQSQLARLIRGNLCTLQHWDWEQQRARPSRCGRC
jgi:DNA-binding transcriptional regulator YiaG